MKNRERFFCLLTLTLVILGLLAGCGSKDSDVQDPDGIIYEYDSIGAGSIMRNGEQIEVLFFYDQETVYIYYNDYFYDLKEPKLLDKAELPTYELHDTDWYAESFYTGDDNGDGSDDLRVTIRHADYSESNIVWTWDKDKGFVYQPEASQFYDTRVVEDQRKYRFMVYGRWGYGSTGEYDCIDIDGEGNWKFYSTDLDSNERYVADEGYLSYSPEDDVAYLCSNVGGELDGSYIEDVGPDWILITPLSYYIYHTYYLFEGLWLCESTDRCDYLQIDADGNWQLWFNGDVIDEGDLLYFEEQGYAVYIRSKLGSAINGGGTCVESSGLCFSDDAVGLDGGRLYFSDYGYFNYLDGRDGQWKGDGGGNWDGEYRGDSEVYHQDISAFEGTWYFENDLSAEAFIMIDGDGNWSIYQRTPGDPEAAEIDCGTLSCSTDETATYHANSSRYDGVNYEMHDLDEGVILWDSDTYYRIGD